MTKISNKLRVSALAAVAICSLTTFAVSPSQTLPVMTIDTENGVPITSKETYLNATYWLDPCGTEGVSALGSAEAPLSLQIRGRGNYTWVGFDKKPYRLKFTDKAAFLGMEKSKHFGLLANTDDDLGFMRNILGFELSRRLGLAWTPAAEPVEVILNNDYIGLYFATELIRVDSKRVNIVEQADNITDPEAITGGWLVEIDNYDTDPHITITEGNGERIIFTYKTPEVLSTEQASWLSEQMSAINAAIYSTDKTSSDWEQYVDMDALARYYIVQELLDDCESFHGSCYMYRDLGADKKWIFGPVWDFGNAYRRGYSGKFIWDEPAFNQTWIGEIYKFPRFQQHVREVWKEFCETGYSGIGDYITRQAERISAAAVKSNERWPQYGNNDVVASAKNVKDLFNSRVAWLGKQWGTQPIPDTPEYTVYLRGELNGWGNSHPLTYDNKTGVYSIENVDIDKEFKFATEDWKTIDLGGDGQTPVELNKEYQLVTPGQNLTIKDNQPLYGVKVEVNPNTKTLLISNDQGVDDIATEGSDHSWRITGLSISAPNHIDVYNAVGALVSSGRGHISLPAAGFYIVVEGNNVAKIAAR